MDPGRPPSLSLSASQRSGLGHSHTQNVAAAAAAAAAADRLRGCAKVVAVLGSSGGSGGTLLGHGDMHGLLTALKRELERAGIGIAAVQVVDCEDPLDLATVNSHTILWGWNATTQQAERLAEGNLNEVNAQAARLDRQIAELVLGEGPDAAAAAGGLRIDGLVVMSCDPDAVNHKTLVAAARRQLPVIGTGGDSLSRAAMNLGVRVIGSSGGSVATTVQSRVFSFASSLAGHWGLPYHAPPAHVSVHGVLGGLWPAFLAVAIAQRLCFEAHAHLLPRLPARLASGMLSRGPPDLAAALPVAACVVACAKVAQLGETALLAGVIAGVVACHGSGSTVLNGLLTGWLAGWLCRRLLVALAKTNRVPPTATSILTAGLAGAAAALVGGLALHGPCLALSEGLRALLAYVETPSLASGGRGAIGLAQVLAGGGVGAGMAYLSEQGLYHSVFLPLICFEMERGGFSYLGAVDWCALCLTSAGVCLAVLLLPPPPSAFAAGAALDPRPLARRGLLNNLLCGDFVEACYPFVAGNAFLKGAVYLAAAWSSALLLAGGVKSSAYLPAPVSWALAAPDPHLATAPALVAFGLPFAATLVHSAAFRLL